MASTKLKKSIHNQLSSPSSRPRRMLEEEEEEERKNLVLRRLDLLATGVLEEVLTQCSPHAGRITSLDVSFSITDLDGLSWMCRHLVNLRMLHAKSCSLCDAAAASPAVAWPKKLRDLDLSRNDLKAIPQGIVDLLHLVKLNLSGNSIHYVPPALLRIPRLKRCLLLNNPIRNLPKDICREGVERMRTYLAVEPLPLPVEPEVAERRPNGREKNVSNKHRSVSISSCSDLRRYVLRNQSSFESGYESSSHQHQRSPSSTSSVSTDIDSLEHSDMDDSESEEAFTGTSSKSLWPSFHSGKIPEGYEEAKSSPLCQLYLPEECQSSERVEVQEVKDLSMHPKLEDNKLLITPVVRITPHGLKFECNKPAIVVLPHCTISRGFEELSIDLLPLCSDTKQYQAPEWTRLKPPSTCEVFEDRILFSTFHFSLFAVAASFSYPSSDVEVRHGMGAELTMPELSGFRLTVPENSIKPSDGTVSIKSTVYYCDRSYRASDELAPASACIGMEPNRLEFDRPVQISIPIPDCSAIRSRFPEAKLELWCAEEELDDRSNVPRNWKKIDVLQPDNIDDNGVLSVVSFATDHFSWYEFLWTLCTSPLQRLGLGASSFYGQLSSRSRFVAIRFQAFMSHPQGKPGKFGLVVAVYKFGEPLSTPSNYPLLVADSGAKRLFLRVGSLHVRVEGCFLASTGDVQEVLERDGAILDFTGEDFCERFEFALNLKAGIPLPLPEGQVLGKLRFIQWEDSRPIHKSYNLIIPFSSAPAGTQMVTTPSTASGNQTSANFTGFHSMVADFTPPRSPEPDFDWIDHHHHHSQSSPPSPSSSSHPPPPRKRIRTDHSHPNLSSISSAKRQLLLREGEGEGESTTSSAITDKVMLNIAQACGSKYMELGIGLGLDYQTIANRISRLEGKTAEHLRAFEVLQEWKCRGASYAGLARALEEIGLDSVAMKYCYVRVCEQ